MEKTEFEIRESVLAECQRLWDELSPERFKPYPEYPDISQFVADGVTESYTVWPFGDPSSYFIIIYTDRAAVDDQWKKAYRLLGLDKRDALEAAREEKKADDVKIQWMRETTQSLQQQLEAEKEKSKRWESRAWKILQIIRRRETEQRPKTAAVLRTFREVSEKNERLVEVLKGIREDYGTTRIERIIDTIDVENPIGKRCSAALEAYKEGKKDEN